MSRSVNDVQHFYDYLPIGVMALNQQRRIKIWNRSMESWSGLSRAETYDRTLTEVFESFDDSKYSERLEEVFNAGAPVILSAPFHGRLVPLTLPDGRDRIQQTTIIPIPAPRGGRWALFAIQDVTDLAAQLKKIRQMKEQAVQAAKRAEEAKALAERRGDQLIAVNRDLEQFAHAASHDLQEPLRTLVSFSTFLKEDLGGDLPEAAQRDLEHIGEAAARMKRLITDLLALSRVSRGELEQSTVPLQECVSESLAALDVRLRECGAEIVGIEALPSVIGDARLLRQVFQNLLGNALKFVEEGCTPHIEVSASRAGSEWLVEVRDRGIGIEEKYLTRIFAPFQRLHGVDRYPGSGMGLAICQRTVERHGGKIWAEANPEGGSSFRFTLPAGEATL